MNIFSTLSIDINLVFVGLAIAGAAILGLVVYISDRASFSNKAFLFFTAITILWGATNYLNYKFDNAFVVLLILRLEIFFATWHAFSLFLLVYAFPDKSVIFSKRYKYILFPLVVVASLVTLSPLAFTELKVLAPIGQVSTVTKGPGMLIFVAVVIFLIARSFTILIKKTKKSEGVDRKQLMLMLIGLSATFFLLAIFNFLLPALFDILWISPLGAVFILPFIACTAYAIIKYQLFNVKVIVTELITFALWIFILVRTLISATPLDRIANATLLLFTVIMGFFLIKSVRKEVSQREKLEILDKELETANDKLKDLDRLKTEFLSLASHQLRSPLTAIKGYTSMLLDGSFGHINDDQKEAIDRVFQSSQHLTKVVEDLLNVTKIEQGGMKYEMMPFDFAKSVKELADDLSITAQKKGLVLTFETDHKEPYIVNGDAEKIRQVILNLIDNSIKYTKEGFIHIKVEKSAPGKIVFSNTDSGMGMTPEIKATLFQKFSRGEGGKVNAGGSGLGLYLAKQITEAHKGRVWVESPGMGLGATFFVELDEYRTH
jgi:signal transduction histidine kinase